MPDSACNVQNEPDAISPIKRDKKRMFDGRLKTFITCVTVFLALFHLYTSVFGLLPAMQQRSFHIAFVLFLVFLLYPATKRSSLNKPTPIDWVCAVLSAICSLYVFLMYKDIAGRAGIYTTYELYLGTIMLALTFEAARRVLGYPLPIFCSLFLLFAYYGRSMPGVLKHFGLSYPRIVEELYLTTDGLFGLVSGVSATYIFLFILFGAFLSSTGTSAFFNDLAMALTGHKKGGPAKIAVISSACMGTISGSTSANVATTGAFTIPLMKKIGYPAYYAGAVEAAASTGGQIMPPVLGSAAFIIADSIGVPYIKVVSTSVIPALLYFWGIWCCLSLEATKLGLEGLNKASLPKVSAVLRQSGYKSLPLFVIIYFLVQGYNPLYSACWGIASSMMLSFVRKEDRLNLKALIATLEDGSKSALSVAVACTLVGVVIGMMGATGIALRVGDTILGYTAGRLMPTLVMTMGIALLLGMGMPTTASYVMASAVAAPALVLIGCKALDVHFFVFFFAVLSSVTPPVCVGAYTAAGIAGADPNRTAFMALKMALPGFIIPFVFIYSPELLLPNVQSWPMFFQALLTALLGVFILATALEGYLLDVMSLPERILAFAAALSMIVPGWKTDLLGFAVLVFLCLFAKRRIRAGKARS
ncbi:TRAP transporter permease [Fretibacterium sp. OH1220_COT-178]|uniref:TRAP transporter permease n=1 Tax=Fretibacterium sp. OH1220_COT-178 TaxID=2491047 RepID=UPI000F5DD0E4|nr:TRAP transporter permease [Fretibacterium sp. OH1220_COT-178]